MDSDQGAFARSVETVRSGTTAAEEAARELYAELTEEERLGLLDGDTPFWQGLAQMTTEGYNVRPIILGSVPRLGIPGIRFVDGPRGCVAGNATAFPVPAARGATWDPDLEERIGEAIGQEIRAQGGNFFGGVCINLLRHPGWGRAQETYGDEPYHLGEMGAALARGAQRWVMACAKHFALNSVENSRFTIDVRVSEGDLHEIYLPHFKRVCAEGVSAVMSAYNSVNGTHAGQSQYLLTHVLRDQWKWPGFTISDFIWGIRDAGASLAAGLDLEAPFAQQRATHLRRQLDEGLVGWDSVRRSGLRILASELRSYATRREETPDAEIMACGQHRALAREAASRSMVLLKNEPVKGAPALPLHADVSRIAVIGRLARAENMGDYGSSRVRPPRHVSPYEGICAAFPDTEIVLVEGDDPDAAAEAAREADVALVIAGFDMHDEGEFVGSSTMSDPALVELFPPAPESPSPRSRSDDPVMTAGNGYGGDRSDLRLRRIDEEIIRRAAQANPNTVVIVVSGSAVLMEDWRHDVPAILMMWYAGMEGGSALGDILTGRANPSGRLPFAIPTSPEHLPAFDPDASETAYGHLHGQRLLNHLAVEPAYPHGFGLSYTSFDIVSATVVEEHLDGARLAVDVRNTGRVGGTHVVQVYGRQGDRSGADEFLVGFCTVRLEAGATAACAVNVSFEPLGTWDGRDIRLPHSTIHLAVSSHANDPRALSLDLHPVSETSRGGDHHHADL